MSKYTFLLSFNLIVKLIQHKAYPSKDQVLDYLRENDINISERTFYRHLEKIKTDFGLDIEYSKIHEGYFINHEESQFNNSLFNVLEHISLTNILTEDLNKNSKNLQLISFDDSRNFKGIEYLKPILLAIQRGQKISFTHYNFQKETHKKRSVTPFLLKEYSNRWYVVGAMNPTEMRVFGIDRISDLEIGSISSIKREQFQEHLKKFNHTIGVYYGDGEPERIVCNVDEILVKYLKSLPLHHSQLIYSTGVSGKYRVEYFLYPNLEFKYQILSFSTKLDIIEPLHLKEEIIGMIEEAQDRYK